MPYLITNARATDTTRRATPNWLKALYAVLATVVLLTVVGAVGAILGG